MLLFLVNKWTEMITVKGLQKGFTASFRIKN